MSIQVQSFIKNNWKKAVKRFLEFSIFILVPIFAYWQLDLQVSPLVWDILNGNLREILPFWFMPETWWYCFLFACIIIPYLALLYLHTKVKIISTMKTAKAKVEVFLNESD